MKLENKIVIVTGSSRGIGKAIALEFAKEGAAVVVTYNQRKKAAEKVKAEIISQGSKAIACQLDVSSRDSVKK